MLRLFNYLAYLKVGFFCYVKDILVIVKIVKSLYFVVVLLQYAVMIDNYVSQCGAIVLGMISGDVFITGSPQKNAD